MKIVTNCAPIGPPYHPRHPWDQRYKSPSGIAPSLVLDFASGIYGKNGVRENGIIQFSRPSSATSYTAAGDLGITPADTARLDYDPVIKSANGILIENQSTNFLLDSETLTQPSWVTVGANLLENQFSDPTGSQNMDRFYESSVAASFHLIRQQISGDTGQVWSFSTYVKPDGREKFRLRLRGFAGSSEWIDANINLATQSTTVISTAGAGTDGVCRLKQVDPENNIWRVSISGTPIVTGGAGVVRATIYLRNDSGTLFYDGNGTSGLGVWGAQLELRKRPSRYISTAGTPVTRSADIASLLSSPWLNSAKGTIVVDFTPQGSLADEWVFSLNDGTVNNHIGLNLNSGSQMQVSLVSSAGANQLSGFNTPSTEQTAYTAVLAYDANDFSFSVNGAPVQTNAVGTVPTGINQLEIGQLSGFQNSLNGSVSRIIYYPERLTDSDVEALSTR